MNLLLIFYVVLLFGCISLAISVITLEQRVKKLEEMVQ